VGTGTYSELLLDFVNAEVRVHLEHLEWVEVAVGVAGLQQSVNLLLRGHRRVSRLSLNNREIHFNNETLNYLFQCWGSVTFWLRIRIRIPESVPLTSGSGSGLLSSLILKDAK
jgi:hypothetical protein